MGQYNEQHRREEADTRPQPASADLFAGARMPQSFPAQIPGQFTDPSQLTPNAQIHQLLKSGMSDTALTLSARNLSLLTADFGATHRFSLYGLSSLMEVSVRANTSSALSLPQVELLTEQVIDRADDYGHFRMQSLARLSEFTSHFGTERPELREISREALACLHMCNPLSETDSLTRQYCAMSQLNSATSVTFWLKQTENPDFRELDYIAACGHERLMQFSSTESEFYYSLYQLRRDFTEPALERLDRLMHNPESSPMIRLVAMEASIQGYLKSGRADKARELFLSLRQELSQIEPEHQGAHIVQRSEKYRARLFPDGIEAY